MDNDKKVEILNQFDNYNTPVSSSLNQYNLTDKQFRGIGNFPQPYIIACGYVTSGGIIDTTKFLIPESIIITHTINSGIYTIKHNIGSQVSNKQLYIPLPQVINSLAIILTLNNITNDSFEVRTFNTAGVAIDSAFTFTISTF